MRRENKGDEFSVGVVISYFLTEEDVVGDKAGKDEVDGPKKLESAGKENSFLTFGK